MATNTMYITSNTIKYHDQVYALHNIAHVEKIPDNLKPVISGKAVFVCGAAVALCFHKLQLVSQAYQKVMGEPPEPGWLVAVLSCLAAVFLYGLWERTRLTAYALVMQTNAGTVKLFRSRDEAVIDDVIHKIHQALEDRSGSVSFHVNLGDVINTTGNDNTIISRTKMGDSSRS